MPWMLNTKIPYLENLPQKRNRNFAVGYDAYEIALLLNNPLSSKQFQLSGMSGNITYNGRDLLRKSLKVDTDIGLLIESLFILPFALFGFYLIVENNVNDFAFNNPSLMFFVLYPGPFLSRC